MVAWLKWAAALAIAGSTAVVAQLQLAKAPPPVLDVNMLFVPPKEVTLGAATGFENMLADGLWLGLLQYYGDRLTIDQAKKVVNVRAMFDLITDLDPHFYFAYWLGTWAIGDGGDPEGAVALLQKGEKANPGDHQYPYLLGFTRFLFTPDFATAADDFERAAALPGAPRFASTMAARLHQKTGHDELALRLWQNMLEQATDAATRQIAKNNVARIEAEIAGKRKRAFGVNRDRAR